MRLLRLVACTAVLLACTVVAAGASAGTAAATTTQFAAPNGSGTRGQCTDVTRPCSLQAALASTEKIGTVSLAGGRYDMARVTLVEGRLLWTATDPQNMPILITSRDAPTLSLTEAQSGSTFENIEVAGTDATDQRSRLCRWAPERSPHSARASSRDATASTLRALGSC